MQSFHLQAEYKYCEGVTCFNTDCPVQVSVGHCNACIMLWLTIKHEIAEIAADDRLTVRQEVCLVCVCTKSICRHCVC